VKWVATRARLAVVALGFLHGTPAAWAQATATTGQIEGTVGDPTGAALPAASVIARNPDTGFERHASTGTNGLFRLVLLPLGRYELVAELPGFAPRAAQDLLLSVGRRSR
jgi:hypothetical protein